MSKRTPLFENHLKLNARMVEYSGFEMPISYAGIKKEHAAVREAAGIFDVSHMGEFLIHGPEALEFIQMLTTNDVSKLSPGRAHYTLMCDGKGGIVDDLLVYRLTSGQYLFVVNAANIEKDLEWICSQNRFEAEVENRSERVALLALQGPASADILREVAEEELVSLPPFSCKTGQVAGEPEVLVSATGYTGEKGYELYINTEQADPSVVWDSLLENGEKYGLQPAGLGARDTLRLEMGFALYGNDMDQDTTPLEVGLGWVVKPEKKYFVGAEAIQEQRKKGVEKRLAGFVMEEPRKIPRPGYEICDSQGAVLGEVTSGTQSVSLGKGIGMGYLPPDSAGEGTEIFISIRKKMIPAVVKSPPFIETS